MAFTPVPTVKATQRLQDLYHLRRLVDAEIAAEEAKLGQLFRSTASEAIAHSNRRRASRQRVKAGRIT